MNFQKPFKNTTHWYSAAVVTLQWVKRPTCTSCLQAIWVRIHLMSNDINFRKKSSHLFSMKSVSVPFHERWLTFASRCPPFWKMKCDHETQTPVAFTSPSKFLQPELTDHTSKHFYFYRVHQLYVIQNKFLGSSAHVAKFELGSFPVY